MDISIHSQKIKIKGSPSNGQEAYESMVTQLESEIVNMIEILKEIKIPIVKQEIIKQWPTQNGNVTIDILEQ